MSIDAGRDTSKKRKRPRHTLDRPTSAGKPGRAKEQLSQFPSQKSVDPSKPMERSVLHGAREKVKEAVRSMRPLRAWWRRLGYYGLALLFVGVAATLRWALWNVLSPAPTLVFYLAWVGAAAFGGLGPGLLATVASWLCIDLLFDPTPGLIGLADPMSIARLWVLLAGGLVVSVVGEKMRRSRIHERRQTEELATANAASRESEERLRQRAEEVETLMDLVPVGIWVAKDPRCDQIVGNQAANRLYEAYRQENVSANVSPVRRFFRDGQELQPEELPMQAAAAQDIDIRDSEVDVLLPSGKWRNLLGSASPLHDAEGCVRGCLGAFLDITERRRAEEALRQSEERFHRLFEDDLTGDFISTAEGRILLCNPAFAEMFGFSGPQEAVGTSIVDLYLDRGEREPLLERLKKERKIGHMEVWRKRRNGERIHVVENLVGHFDEQGELGEIKGYLFEDTERKRAEEALRELTATLESKVAQRTAEVKHRVRQLQKLTLEMSEAEDRERGRLAQILHDDLQQVLAAAKFHVGLMRNRAQHDSSLQATAAQVDHMLKDAIEKSRSLSHELSPAVLHHGDFTETLGWLAHQVQAKHGLVVHVHTHGPVVLQSDALKGLLYKAAQELLFNVVKHARVKEAGIRVRRCGPCVCLSVSDRGRGFDPQELRQVAGFGLLSIRERIELLGGRMKIKSAPGQGSTFSIVVPDGAEEGERTRR